MNLSACFVFVAVALLFAGCLSNSTTQATPLPSATPSVTIESSEVIELTVKKGDEVKVDYLGTLEDGTVFDTSIQAEAEKAGLPKRPFYEPLAFVVGAGQMIKGFDQAVIGMKVGDEKTVSILPKDAYGESDPTRVLSLPTSQLRQMLGAEPKEGMVVATANGMQGQIVSIDANNTKIDLNHRLAGKTLLFKIIMRKITQNT
ncbi:MAG: peptidylprolyl isomerase [Candidatus Micrarchaeia archaeon]